MSDMKSQDQSERMEVDDGISSRKRGHVSTDEETILHGRQRNKESSAREKTVPKKKVALLNVPANKQQPAEVISKNREEQKKKKEGIPNPPPRARGNDDGKIRYDAFSKQPFLVIVRKVSANRQTAKQMSLLEIAKVLKKSNLKFSTISKYSFNTWKVIFTSKTLANNAIENKLLKEQGLISFIPGYKLSRSMVVRGIPMDFESEELKSAIEDENPNIIVMKMFRLKRRDKMTGYLVDSESVCFTIKGEVMPESVKILCTINKVNPYVPAVRLCYRCGSIGHISKTCVKDVRCLTCAGNHQGGKDNPCSLEKKCINCNGNHRTVDRSCPVHKKQAEISRIMAYDNVPFFEARRVVEDKEKENSSRLSTTKSYADATGGAGTLGDLLPATPGGRRDHPIMDTHREKISHLLNLILSAGDIERLILRLVNTVELHNLHPQETWLSPSSQFIIRGFDSIRKDRADGSGGGVMILINQNIRYRSLNISKDCGGKIEACGVEIFSEDSGRIVKLIWIPAHKGITGNERADEMAKDSIRTGIDTKLSIPLYEIKNFWKERAREELVQWCQREGVNRGSLYCNKFLVEAKHPWFWREGVSRRTISSINRLRSGHTSLRASLYRFNIVDSPTCELCKVDDETPDHIFWSCTTLEQHRINFRKGLVEARGFLPHPMDYLLATLDTDVIDILDCFINSIGKYI